MQAIYLLLRGIFLMFIVLAGLLIVTGVIIKTTKEVTIKMILLLTIIFVVIMGCVGYLAFITHNF